MKFIAEFFFLSCHYFNSKTQLIFYSQSLYYSRILQGPRPAFLRLGAFLVEENGNAIFYNLSQIDQCPGRQSESRTDNIVLKNMTT